MATFDDQILGRQESMRGSAISSPRPIAVALGWSDGLPRIEPLSGAAMVEPKAAGWNDAERTALEVSLALAEQWGTSVVAITVGPLDAEQALKAAIAAGAASGVLVRTDREDWANGLPADRTAAAVAAVVRSVGAGMVVCGACSGRRGSGVTPAYIAAHLDWPQALGLTDLDAAPSSGEDHSIASDATGVASSGGQPMRLRVSRRLGGGRRELLDLEGPAVISLEGAARFGGRTALLRRAALSRVVAAEEWQPEVRDLAQLAKPGPAGVEAEPVPRRPAPPRIAGPQGERAWDRVVDAVGLVDPSVGGVAVALDPDAAAAAILEALATWGFVLPDHGSQDLSTRDAG